MGLAPAVMAGPTSARARAAATRRAGGAGVDGLVLRPCASEATHGGVRSLQKGGEGGGEAVKQREGGGTKVILRMYSC